MGHTPKGGQASDQASNGNAQGRGGGVGHIKSKTQRSEWSRVTTPPLTPILAASTRLP